MFITTIYIHNFLSDIRGTAGNKKFENPGNKPTNRTSFLGKSQQQYQNIGGRYDDLTRGIFEKA